MNGTYVYGTARTKNGTIEHLLIDKPSEREAYAIMGFGGFLGLSDGHLPVPWNALRYDTQLGGYITGITENQVKDAPQYAGGVFDTRDWET